ncbi:ABC transporter ATP-binding protein [uncultured Meiothermus sp.]|jgi:ABC-type multidrug transport system ATPase subunit|uniref:ATP-binding cassette domain-containing protein n=1 Tax=uncultured Meiothermus sp. TaxID=157471 RepID=UPI002603C5CE|nr:ABC transporter ATP-binding protein [uncultured Meiothermus sp.]
MVEAVGLSKQGRLYDLHLRLTEGSLALLGPNGAGKSTALALLAGRIRPDGGLARVFGFPPRSLEAARLRAYIPQQLSFPPNLRVKEVLEAARQLKGASPAQLKDAVDHMGLEEQMHRTVAQLSGGWRQRLALAAGLQGQSPLWLLDEPASALDSQGLHRLTHWIQDHRNQGGLVLLSAHRQEEIAALAQRAIWLEGGRIADTRSPAPQVKHEKPA